MRARLSSSRKDAEKEEAKVCLGRHGCQADSHFVLSRQSMLQRILTILQQNKAASFQP